MGRQKYTRLIGNNAGNVSITTGIVGVMLLTAVGATMDGGRMFSTKQKLQSITDAAALSATMPEGISAQRRKEIARRSIESHVAQTRGLNIDQTDIKIVDNGRQVKVSLASEVPMIFGAVLGSDQRRVSVSSLAEESTSSNSANVSISVVLDLSSSMSEKFDRSNRINSVRNALNDTFQSIESQFGGEALAATRVNTGLYPFNWGQVDGETVALAPGTESVKTAMNFLALSEGAVPSEAMETAVQDMIDVGGSNQQNYVIYISDGRVENEKSDAPGQYLSSAFVNQEGWTSGCRTAVRKLDDLTQELDRKLTRISQKDPGLHSYTSPLRQTSNSERSETVGQIIEDGRRIGTEAESGGCHSWCQDIKTITKKTEKALTRVTLKCKPVQTQRVLDACESARDNNVSMIAIDLASKEKQAEDLARLCVNPKLVKEEVKENARNARQGTTSEAPSSNTQTLSEGLEVTVSADGKSMAASVESLSQLKEVLATMLPEADKGTRTVRLIG